MKAVGGATNIVVDAAMSMYCCCAVCDDAAEYLTAIARQPLLAVGAVAPELYGRLPALARAHELRLRSSRALSAARGAGPAASARVRQLPPWHVGSRWCTLMLS